jgi:tRNA (cmo5U34)-methyltransferase
MGERAKEQLRAFGERVTVVHADLSSPSWQGAMDPPYDGAVSTIAIHNLRDPVRIRALYAEVFQLLAPGGFFMNLDYVRPASPELRALLSWARGDPAGAQPGRSSGGTSPGGMGDQLQWLRDAGFDPVDCFWKEFQAALFGGFKAPVRIPGAR